MLQKPVKCLSLNGSKNMLVGRVALKFENVEDVLPFGRDLYF